LAAMTAVLINADLLIMATNTFGIYNLDPDSKSFKETIPEVRSISEVLSSISDEKSALGSGGMASKIEACEIAQNVGIETWLVYGYDENFLVDVFERKVKFTKVLGK
jgi:glutamate 5-kinase